MRSDVMHWVKVKFRMRGCQNQAFKLSELKFGKILLGWHILFLVTETSGVAL